MSNGDCPLDNKINSQKSKLNAIYWTCSIFFNVFVYWNIVLQKLYVGLYRMMFLRSCQVFKIVF